MKHFINTMVVYLELYLVAVVYKTFAHKKATLTQFTNIS